MRSPVVEWIGLAPIGVLPLRLRVTPYRGLGGRVPVRCGAPRSFRPSKASS